MRRPGSADCTRGMCRCNRSDRERHESPTAAPRSTTSTSTPRRRRQAATASPAGPAPTTSTSASIGPPAGTLVEPGGSGCPECPVEAVEDQVQAVLELVPVVVAGPQDVFDGQLGEVRELTGGHPREHLPSDLL